MDRSYILESCKGHSTVDYDSILKFRSVAISLMQIFGELCQQRILMKYHVSFVIFLKKKKQQNLILLSAANSRWHFMG